LKDLRNICSILPDQLPPPSEVLINSCFAQNWELKKVSKNSWAIEEDETNKSEQRFKSVFAPSILEWQCNGT
jgi:hypothetical protein